MTINTELLQSFTGKVVNDISAAFAGVMTNIGHKLGLYKAMAGEGQMTSTQLAAATRTHERYIREWLNSQSAGGYVLYHSDTNTYSLPDEHVPVLVDETSPVFLAPALEVAASLWFDEEKVVAVFKSGEGIAWGDHHHSLFCGSESLFRPGYKAHLTTQWITALDGVENKLKSGAKIADIGCGHGASTIVMAKAYPNSSLYGFDYHPPSVEIAKSRAQNEGVENNTHFLVSHSQNYSEKEFDLICFMDCLHDMGDPIGAARHARKALKNDGTVLLIEPAAGNSVEENINPIGRLYYSASTAVCTPCSLSQDVGLALGAQAGEQRLSEVMIEAGFTSIRRVAETPFNIVLEAIA